MSVSMSSACMLACFYNDSALAVPKPARHDPGAAGCQMSVGYQYLLAA